MPEVSSENRRYIPVGFVNKKVIASNLLYTVSNATLYTFGILASDMHMAWARYVCGRLKSDFRYSSGLVYNNYPWPQTPTKEQKAAVEKAAQAVLNVRAQFMGSAPAPGAVADALVGNPEGATTSPRAGKQSARARTATAGAAVLPKTNSTLADLYDPVAMPPALAKAHAELDRAVDRCYRKEPFASDRARVEYLFQLYEQLTAPLLPADSKSRRKRIQ